MSFLDKIFKPKNKTSTLKEWDDYTFTYNPNDEKGYAIKIERGNYEGVIFAINQVIFNEDRQNKNLNISFNYDIIQEPEDIIIDRLDFEKHVADILDSIFSNIQASGEFANQQIQVTELNGHTDSNSTKFNSK